jgi:hypothetical protein
LTDTHLVSGENDRYEFTKHDRFGNLLQIARLRLEPTAVTAEDRASVSQELYPNITLPAVKPAFSRILLDEVGNYWIEQFQWLPTGADPRWEVLDEGGSWLTTVVVPSELRITQIGADHILGTVRDSTDTEYVQLHRLQKGTRGN